MTTLTLFYENGLFKPLGTVTVPNRSTVTVDITDISTADASATEADTDPMFSLVGVFLDEEKPLIDDIPVSVDPELYVIAAEMGDAAEGLHAWEIAPGRYSRGVDGRPVRRNTTESESG